MNIVHAKHQEFRSLDIKQSSSHPGGLRVPPFGAFDGYRKRPVILICGDLHNFGDLALLTQNLAIARDEGRVAFVRCWGKHPRAAQRHIEHYGGKCVDGRDIIRFLQKSKDCDFVIGGGQMVRANASLRSLISLCAGVRLAQLNGGRIETRGLGIGPVSGTRRRLWRAILSTTGQVRVRDQASAEHGADLVPPSWIEVTADMVFAGDELTKNVSISSRQPLVIIAPCLDQSEKRQIDAAALRGLKFLIDRRLPNCNTVFVCHDSRPGMDFEAAGDLLHASGITAERVGMNDTLETFLEHYASAKLVITNRLHSGIFAILFDKPLLILDDGNLKLKQLTETFDVPSIALGGPLDAATIGTAFDRALNFDLQKRQAMRQAMAGRAARNVMPRRVAIFNVKYSPNLGDGIIAECLESELRRACPDIVPHSIDLAGRASFDRSHGRHRKLVLGLRERIPARLRHKLMPIALDLVVRFRLAKRWRRELAACEAAIIGGGALFADADQNFPIKIAHALTLCSKRQLPTAIASVGVTGGWSRQGLKRVMKKAREACLVSVTTRDLQSAETWRTEFASRGLPVANVAPDPGLLCVDHLAPARPATGEGKAAVRMIPMIGICVTDPLVLRLHSDQSHGGNHLEAWIVATVEQLLLRPCRIVLFTNGSPEDEAFKQLIAGQLSHIEAVESAPQFATPTELAGFISGLDCVLAHRLHACIAAYSYRIPSIGFAWDRKLAHFFAASDRDRYLIDPREMSPGSLAALTWQVLADPPDEETHERLLTECRAGIASLADSLMSALR